MGAAWPAFSNARLARCERRELDRVIGNRTQFQAIIDLRSALRPFRRTSCTRAEQASSLMDKLSEDSESAGCKLADLRNPYCPTGTTTAG